MDWKIGVRIKWATIRCLAFEEQLMKTAVAIKQN